MAVTAIGAMMIVISYTTSGTPTQYLDDTHVRTSTYENLEDCIYFLKQYPLSDTELETEKRLKLRTIRICSEPQSNTYYTWTDGHVVGEKGTVVETGPISPR